MNVLRKMLLLAGLVAFVQAAFWLGGVSEATLAGRVTLTLGFLMLAAHLTGRLAARLELPLITGYLLAGIVFGPQVFAFVTLDVKQALEIITRLALGLIALTAGGELRMAELRPKARSLAWIVALQTLGLFLGVAGVIAVAGRFAAPSWFARSAALSGPEIAALAFIMGLVAVANSPSTTVAVINEARASGPLTTLSIGVTVLKDVVVIVLLAVTLGAVAGLLQPGGEGFAARLPAIGVEIGVSLALGALMGGALILYLARIGHEVSLVLLGVVFLAIEVTGAIEARFHLHVHFLLVCMTAGFVVENASKLGHDLIEGIERSSLPVFVVFFALIGVGLDLVALQLVWPLALIVCLVRAALLALTSWGGARLGGEGSAVAAWSWSGFVAQAGISLGLAELVAARYPELGQTARTLILAVVAVNQVSGPILFKVALRRVGEARAG